MTYQGQLLDLQAAVRSWEVTPDMRASCHEVCHRQEKAVLRPEGDDGPLRKITSFPQFQVQHNTIPSENVPPVCCSMTLRRTRPGQLSCRLCKKPDLPAWIEPRTQERPKKSLPTQGNQEQDPSAHARLDRFLTASHSLPFGKLRPLRVMLCPPPIQVLVLQAAGLNRAHAGLQDGATPSDDPYR